MSPIDTKRTCWAVLTMSVDGRSPEVAGRPRMTLSGSSQLGLVAYCRNAPETLELSGGKTFSRSAIPSARAAPVDRSMQRPFTNGPRSLTRTLTLRPLDCEVTVT